MPLPAFNARGLLPDGIHDATIDELHARSVVEFPGSATRADIFANFVRYRDAIVALGFSVTQWVDGSFVDLTRRDPEDIDVVNFCESDNIRAASAGIDEIDRLLGAGRDTVPEYQVHSFFVPAYDYDHHLWGKFEMQRKYWRRQFSQPLNYPRKHLAPERGPKGIVQITLGDATLCPRIDRSP
jgi:hypothetical protein